MIRGAREAGREEDAFSAHGGPDDLFLDCELRGDFPLRAAFRNGLRPTDRRRSRRETKPEKDSKELLEDFA